MNSFQWQKIQRLLRTELKHFTAINSSDRRWQMPFAAALATGFPLLIGAAVGKLNYGLVAALGGLVFLYLPETLLSHRMVALLACAFGMTASYALGVMSHSSHH